MTPTPARPVVGLIGPGRAGVGLALALSQAGYAVRLHGRKKKKVPAPLTLTVGDGETPPEWIGATGVVILAVRDDGIRPLAEALAAARAITSDHVVLHLSGAQGQEVLEEDLVPVPAREDDQPARDIGHRRGRSQQQAPGER